MNTKVKNIICLSCTIGGVILSGIAALLSPSTNQLQKQIEDLQTEVNQLKKV